MDNLNKETQNTWDAVADLYQQTFMDFELYNDTLDSFCSALKKQNAQILELGCGPGNITRYIDKKLPSAKIIATDYTKSMIQLARYNVPNVDFIQMDCRKISKLKETFDGIICGFVLPYLSKEETSKFINDCAKKLNPNGILYISFVPGNEKLSGFKQSSSGENRLYFNYHELENIQNDLEKEHFKIMHLTNKNYVSKSGEKEVHTILIAQK